MPTVAEQNAAFDVIHAEVLDLIRLKGGFFSGKIRATFESPDGQRFLLKAVHDGLVAAEKARA